VVANMLVDGILEETDIEHHMLADQALVKID
jgi:hypothetical protein